MREDSFTQRKSPECQRQCVYELVGDGVTVRVTFRQAIYFFLSAEKREQPPETSTRLFI